MYRSQVRLFAFFDIDGVAYAVDHAIDGSVIFLNASDRTLLTLTHGEMADMIARGRMRARR